MREMLEDEVSRMQAEDQVRPEGVPPQDVEVPVRPEGTPAADVSVVSTALAAKNTVLKARLREYGQTPQDAATVAVLALVRTKRSRRTLQARIYRATKTS